MLLYARMAISEVVVGSYVLLSCAVLYVCQYISLCEYLLSTFLQETSRDSTSALWPCGRVTVHLSHFATANIVLTA